MSKPCARPKRIALLGPFSFGNLGNAALQEVLVQHFRRRFPEAELYGCYIDVEMSADELPIRAFPLNRTVPWPEVQATSAGSGQVGRKRTKQEARLSILPAKVTKAFDRIREVREELVFCAGAHEFVKGFRLLVFGLGGLFDEVWGGKWGDLYSYFRWAVLARLAGIPLVCISVGLEEVNTKLGRLFCKTALRLADYRSFRDVESKEKAEAMGVTGENRVFPDLAFGLEVDGSLTRENDRTKRDAVGVSPMAYCDPRFWPIKNLSVYNEYLAKLGSFVSWLLREGRQVVLFPTQVRMDRLAIEELKAAALRDVAPSLHSRLTEANVRSVDDCLGLLSRLDVVVTSRLHGVILSYLAGSPVLAVSPASKIDRLMEDMDLKEYVLNIREFDAPMLVERFKKLEDNRERVHRKIRHKVAQYHREVESQFELLFRTVASPDLAQ